MWIVLQVFYETQWQALCAAAGGALAGFGAATGRLARREELDARETTGAVARD